MAHQAYFPKAEAAQVTWLQNYKNKITTHLTTLGMTSELPSTNYDLGCAIFVLETWNPQIQQDAQEATAYKKMLLTSPAAGLPVVPLPVATTFTPPTIAPPGIFARLFLQVQRIKTNPSYTPVMGTDLQIIGAEDSAVHLTPEFTAAVLDAPGGQFVRLKFTKFGHDGVYIECRRNGGAWNFLNTDMVTPYDDKQALLVANTPETREYRMSFMDAGDQNGDWTMVMKVTVGA